MSYPLIIDEGNEVVFLDRESEEVTGHVHKDMLVMTDKNRIRSIDSALIRDAFYCFIGEQEFDEDPR